MKKLLFSIIAMSAINSHDVHTMTPSGSSYFLQLNDSFLKKHVSEWPVVDPIPLAEKEYYDKTWDYGLDLHENKQKVVRMFLEYCVDSSLRIMERRSDGGCLGVTESGEQIEFFHSLLKKNIFSMSFDMKTIAFFNNADAFDFDHEYQEKVFTYLRELANNAEGCELLRICTAAYMAEPMSKIIFVPIIGNRKKFYFMPGLFFTEIKTIAGGYWDKVNTKCSNFITFPAKESYSNSSFCSFGATLSLIGRSYQLAFKKLPDDIYMYYVILRSLNSKRGNNLNGKVESVKQYVTSTSAPYYIVFFNNDESFQTLFGVSSSGISPLSVASYSLSAHNFILISRYGYPSVIENDFAEKIERFFKKYFSVQRKDLYDFFLNPAVNRLCHQFGVDQYTYSEQIK